MAVDANFASLFEKLKVEDPWLSPTTWESIPSQNVARTYPSNSPPPPPPLHSASSISEASLVRLALNAMQGVESALVSIEKLSVAFCSDPADRSYHSIPSLWNRSSSTQGLGNILKSIGLLGCLVFFLRKFVDNFMYMNLNMHSSGNGHENTESVSQSYCYSGIQKEECLSYSLVNQAFAVAIGKVLEGYTCALNTVHASAKLRGSSKNVNMVLHKSYEEAFLSSIVHSKVTLLELYLHTKELRTQIEALGNICKIYNIALCFSVSPLEELTAKVALEFSNFYKGGDLLTYLYMHLQVADPAHRALLKFLFLRSFEPYCGFIRSWIFKAETSDPYKEFIVECTENLPTNLHYKAGISFDFPFASMRDGVAVPCFLKDFLIPIIRVGQQLQVLKKLLELCNYAGSGDYSFEDFLPSFRGYLSDHLFFASPVTFNKEHLEAMVTIRNNNYRKMQDKLGNLLTKLEFRYLQVVPHGAVPAFIDNSREGANGEVAFALNDGLFVSSTAGKWSSKMAVDKIESDYSSTRDWSCEASDCSSLSFEDQTEAEQLTMWPSSLFGLENRYLSSLMFSMSSPIDDTLEKSTQSSRDMEIIFHENCLKGYVFGHFVQSYHEKGSLSHMSVPLGLGNSNLSRISATQDTHALTDNCWPLGIPNNLFYGDEGYRYWWRLNQCNSAIDVMKTDIVSINEGLPCLSKMPCINVVSKEGLDKHQLENDFHASNSFILQPWKHNYHSNLPSTNPMLRRSTLFHPIGKPGETCSSAYGQSLPNMDFSTVEDPCKVSAEKLAASLRQEFGSQVPSPDTANKGHDKDKQACDAENVSIDTSRMSCPCSHLDLKEQDQEALVSTNVLGGKTWESLLNSYSHMGKESVREHEDNMSSLFEIPLDFIIDKCLLQEILLQYKYVSKLAIKMLEGFHFHEHLLALRRYYFMELADWADLFIISLRHHKWSAAEADQRISEIQGFLELSIRRSSCELDPNKDRLFLYIKGNTIMPLSTSAIGIHCFDFLGLGYRVDWPVSIVLTPSALRIYADIFNFLIQVKLAVFSLTDVWCSLKDLKHFISKKRHYVSREREVVQFNMLIRMRHKVYHFISTLLQYVQSQLSHISWHRFHHNLKHKVKDMMDLESIHMEYLTDSLRICFLSDETRPIANIIESILQCALDFQSCIMWDAGFDQEDSLDKLPRINISQVLSIKQKFDKNLKEMHLCYLKSPGHRKFGLSCFWGYLNYNEYYSEIGNKMNF